MSQPSLVDRVRRRLAHFILKATLYGSWALGLFPFTFDSRKWQLKRSKRLLAYGLVLNVGLLTMACLSDTDDHDAVKVEVFERNPLVKHLESLVAIVSLVTTVVTHVRTVWHSGNLKEILNELLLLERNHFRHLILGNCHQFDWHVIQKGLLIVLEIASSLVIYFGIPESRVVVQEAMSIYLVQLQMLLMVMHFHMAVLYIYRFVWTINGQLLEVANQLRRSERVDPDRIHQLLGLYGRVLDLSDRLASIYDVQMILFMGTLVSANIIVAHVLVILAINIKRYAVIRIILILPQALAVNLWDLCQGIATCDLAESTGRKTSTILKLFNDMACSTDKTLQSSIDEFALFTSHRRLRYRHCGLFYINFEMGFHIIITNILYVLFLVQFDYMNLKFK
ncbi:hypothetical protein KR018_009359 [Drosophila ironensis]|nr:hypothetical protein KR018_009359 [Drosophila ironensis]